VTTGVPWRRGRVADVSRIGLEDEDGLPHPVQACALDHWPDGSIRWLLVDFQTSAGHRQPRPYRVVVSDAIPVLSDTPVSVQETPGGIEVSVGGTTIGIVRGGSFPMSSVVCAGRPLVDTRSPGFGIRHGGRLTHWTVADVTVLASGPLRAELLVQAAPAADSTLPMHLTARVQVFAGAATVQCDVTLHNPRRALHSGGQWPLGDPGSLLFESASVRWQLMAPVTTVRCSIDGHTTHEAVALPFELLQASSGGDHWNSRTHVNRDGRVPLPFRGYRLRAGDIERSGDRASPCVTVGGAAGTICVTVPEFWQAFPSGMSVRGSSLELDLFPAGAGDLHELQGGERTTRTFFASFGEDSVTAPPSSWCSAPIRYVPSPAYVSATEVLPCIELVDAALHPDYLTLVASALDPTHGFAAKIESADEYGWRHFGDLPADHESAFQPAGHPFVSHYNNQYDAIAGFGLHFLRTGDPRWWSLMDALARHVRDIDVYHTSQDKAAYNGGLFWHTNHYVDAGTSTHRTYPKGGSSGGGPSAEHNYNFGLMLHYFLTGDRTSRDTAVQLGQWVIDMDDGSRTPFRWLSRASTGLASFTASHHHPGRGAGHSIVACLTAHRLTGDRKYLDKAESLIARSVHPDEGIPLLYVESIETHWSYTAFLQALGLYLEDKIVLGQLDGAFRHAQRSLLAFARWMVEHERPYLERSHLLQYPTETWVAQDLRKADVFFWAARHTSGAERERFVEQSRFYLDYVAVTLPGMAGYSFTRPLVLAITQGLRPAALFSDSVRLPHAPEPDPGSEGPTRGAPFRSQRVIAIRRASILAAIGVAAATAALAWVVSQ
jgi:hypothetical protein